MLRIAWSPVYRHPLPPGHRFPMEKYDLIPEQLIYEGVIGPENLFEPQTLNEEILLRAHTAEYWWRLQNLDLTRQEERRTGFPHNAALIHRETVIAQGTLACCDYALKYGVALNVSGGTHHAFADKGEGFCLLNDVAIAAQELRYTGKARKILVIDLDVHQGNGTAFIFQNNPDVYTFSMHGANNFPLKKETSSRDVALPDQAPDEAYLRILNNELPRLMDEVQPDFAFYVAGADVLATDRLGKLALSLDGCRLRDRLVFEHCKRNKVPVTAVMGGGYSPRVADVVQAHCHTFRQALDVYF